MIDLTDTINKRMGLKSYKKTGREIFNMDVIGGLNRIPVEAHQQNVLSTIANLEELPDSVPEVLERLLVDGYIMLYEGEFVSVEHDDKLPYQILPNGYIRTFIEEDNKWLVRDYADVQLKNLKNETVLAGDAIYHYRKNNGIFDKAQRTLFRIVSIWETLEKNTDSYSLGLLISGYIGNLDKAENELKSGKKIISIPMDISAQEIDFTKASGPLLNEIKELTPYYYQLTGMVKVEDKSHVSGSAKRLVMMPLFSKYMELKADLTAIYSSAGFNIIFNPFELEDIDTRIQKYNHLKQKMADGVITEEQFKIQGKNL